MEKSIYSKDYKALIKRIRDARKQAGVTQEVLAKRLKQTQSFVSKCERRERRLDVVELRAFCRALRVPFVDFVRAFDRSLKK